MTVERRLLVGLEDIKAVAFQCDSCKFRITMSPDDIRELPKNCPNGHRWIIGEPEVTSVPTLIKFAELLAALRKLRAQKVLGYSVLFEFDEPKTT
jgi:hypothetical protein